MAHRYKFFFAKELEPLIGRKVILADKRGMTFEGTITHVNKRTFRLLLERITKSGQLYKWGIVYPLSERYSIVLHETQKQL